MRKLTNRILKSTLDLLLISSNDMVSNDIIDRTIRQDTEVIQQVCNELIQTGLLNYRDQQYQI